MFCAHCSCDTEDMPGWKHDARPADAHGTVEHLWWAIFPKYGFQFAAGVSVKRNPIVDPHYNGAASFTWKLKRHGGDSPTCEGSAGGVISAAIRMAGDSNAGEFSLITTWAATLQSHGAKKPVKYLPAEDFTPTF